MGKRLLLFVWLFYITPPPTQGQPRLLSRLLKLRLGLGELNKPSRFISWRAGDVRMKGLWNRAAQGRVRVMELFSLSIGVGFPESIHMLEFIE